jgi:adenosylcobinamide-GDP ribazoletransferase
VSIRSLRAALSFLTVLPVASSETGPGERLGRAYFPAVGAAIGAIAAGAFLVAYALWTPLVAAAVGVGVLAAVTGALHLDGLADTADGLLGARDRARRLEIMRDPRLGSFAVVAVVTVLVLQVAALAAMSPPRAAAGLVIAGALSRLAALVVVAWLPYVRSDGLGTAAADARHRGLDLAVGALTALVVCLLDWRRAAMAVVVCALVTLLVGRQARRGIGGATGDVYGATAELTQAATLLVFAVQ